MDSIAVSRRKEQQKKIVETKIKKEFECVHQSLHTDSILS